MCKVPNKLASFSPFCSTISLALVFNILGWFADVFFGLSFLHFYFMSFPGIVLRHFHIYNLCRLFENVFPLWLSLYIYFAVDIAKIFSSNIFENCFILREKTVNFSSKLHKNSCKTLVQFRRQIRNLRISSDDRLIFRVACAPNELCPPLLLLFLF